MFYDGKPDTIACTAVRTSVRPTRKTDTVLGTTMVDVLLSNRAKLGTRIRVCFFLFFAEDRSTFTRLRIEVKSDPSSLLTQTYVFYNLTVIMPARYDECHVSCRKNPQYRWNAVGPVRSTFM